MHIFAIPSWSRHEKRCRILVRLFYLFQCSRNPQCSGSNAITFCADLTPQLLRYFLTATDSEKEVEMPATADSGILQELSSEFHSRLSIVRQINFWKYHDIVQSMDIIANYGHLLTMKELILLNHAQLGKNKFWRNQCQQFQTIWFWSGQSGFCHTSKRFLLSFVLKMLWIRLSNFLFMPCWYSTFIFKVRIRSNQILNFKVRISSNRIWFYNWN